MSESSQSSNRDKDVPNLEAQLDSLMSKISNHLPDLSPDMKLAQASSKAMPKAGQEVSSVPVSDPESTLMSKTHTSHASTDSTDTISGHFTPPPTPNVPVADATASGEKEGGDLVGDKLAEQIQELLDDTKKLATEATSSALTEKTTDLNVPASTAADTSASMAAKSPEPESSSSDDATSDATKVSQANVPATELSDENIIKALNELDKEIAQGADQAVAGEFESVQNVVNQSRTNSSTPLTAPSQESLPAAASVAASQVAAIVPETGGIPTTKSAAPGAAGGASAADVAHELDSQPDKSLELALPSSKHAPLVVPNLTSIEAKTASNAPAATRRKEPIPGNTPQRKSLLGTCSIIIRRMLGAVNSPLEGLSHSYRMAVGWVGLLTLINATVLIVMTLVRTRLHH